MLKLIASAALAAGIIVGPAAFGADPQIASKADRRGDVHVAGDATGVDPAIVRSVDLRHVTVTRQPHGVRVVIRLKQVLPARGRWFQQISVFSVPPSWVAPDWFFVAMTTPQHLGGSAAYFVDIDAEAAADPDGEEEELVCKVDAKKGKKVVSLSIPDRCLPEESGQLVVDAVLADKANLDSPLVAEDQLKVGLVDLRPGR